MSARPLTSGAGHASFEAVADSGSSSFSRAISRRVIDGIDPLLFNRTGEHLTPRLHGYRLVDGEYERMPTSAGGEVERVGSGAPTA